MIRGFETRRTIGLLGGELIQFVEGCWPDEIGDGLAVTDTGFDLIEPIIRAACSNWTSAHRFGVFDLPASVRQSIIAMLRGEATRLTSSARIEEAELLNELARWLDARREAVSISILGL